MDFVIETYHENETGREKIEISLVYFVFVSIGSYEFETIEPGTKLPEQNYDKFGRMKVLLFVVNVNIMTIG